MQILALALNHTKSYAQARITFSAGVNAIVGQNGAGKSTILEAIGFALFDTLDYKQDEFVQEGADAAEIIVDFRSNGDERVYQAMRRFGASSYHRIFDPELQLKICEGKADVMRFLRQQMGVDAGFDLAALFRDAVGVPQGTLTAVFLEAASKRKTTFDRLLQVEEYSRAAERLREPARLLRDRRQALEVQISALAARVERLAPLQAAVERRAAAIAAAGAESKQTTASLEKTSAQRMEMEALQQRVSTLRNRQAQITSQLDGLATQQTAAGRRLQQAQAARQEVQKNQPGHDQYLAAQTQQHALDAQVRQRQKLAHQHADLEKQAAQVQAVLATAQRDLSEAAEAEKVVAGLADAVEQQERLEAELGAAREQQARLNDAHEQVARQQEQAERLRDRHAALTAQLAQLAALQTRAQAIEQTLAEQRTAIDQAKTEQLLFKSSADAVKKQNEALADITTAKCPVCEQPLSESHRSAMLQRNEERLAALRADYKQASEQVRQGETALKAHDAERQQVQKQMLRLPRAEELAQNEREAEQVAAALAAAHTLVEQLALAPQQVAELQAALHDLADPRRQSAIAAATAARRPAIEAQQRKAADQLATIEQQTAVLQTELAAFGALDEALATVQADLRAHEPAYQAVLTHQQLAATVAECEAEVERLHDLTVANERELSEVSNDLAAQEAQFDAAAFQKILGEEQQLRSRLGELRAQTALMATQQAADENEIALLEGQQAELAALKDDMAKLGRQEDVLDAMRDTLKKAGPQVTKALIQQVSSSADQIFCDMMQDYQRRLTWHDDYGITLEVEGRERQFAQLSGGEQMCAALAVRLALLREMSNIDIAFFDEPTTNLDEMRRESLVRQILDIKGFRQLFVISHDDTFEQATQNMIRIERVDGLSAIVNE